MVRRWLQDSAARQEAATGQVIERVAAEVGHELFERTLQKDPKLRSLFMNSMEAAFRTGLEEKRWLFGALVRDAILDESLFEYSWLMSQALSEIDAPHIVALEKLRRFDQEMEAELRKDDPVGDQSLMEELPTPRFWDSELRGQWAAIPAPIRATLIRTALAIDPAEDEYGGPVRRVTDFGVDLLVKLPASVPSSTSSRAQAPDQSSPQ